jgi:hypothetical protein
MQAASVNYAMAASGAGGTWADPLVRADWFSDGYSSIPTGARATLVVRDDFERSILSGLGHNRAGRSWTTSGGSASNYYTDAGAAYQSHTSVGTLLFSFIDLGDTDFDVVATIEVPVTPTGGSITARVSGRAADASNYLEANVQITTAGAVQLGISKRVGGSGSNLTSFDTILTGFTGGTSLTVRFRGVGSALKARVWRSIGDEPTTTWHQSVAHTEPLLTGTLVGFESRLESGNTNTLPVPIAFSDFRAISPGIDDLSALAGSWTVEHDLDDGYPDSVTFVTGEGFGQATVEDLGSPAIYLTDGEPMEPAAFFSPYNDRSPVFGLDRDVAPVTIDHGLVTTAGIERVRVFTGQMSDILVKGGRATLTATSATRLRMLKLVQPPAFAWNEVGLNGTWPVSWALAQCEIYVSPPPRDGCRWWVPMHGSTRPFVPSQNVQLDDDATFWGASEILSPTDLRSWRPEWITGPFMLAPHCRVTADETFRVSQSAIEFGDGDDMFSQAGNKGRLEFWARGDATDVNGSVGGSATVTRLAGMRMMTDLVAGRGYFMGLDRDRRAFVTVNDGTNSATLTSDDTLPTDGEWYLVGAAYDMTAEKLWVTNFGGTTKSTTASALNAALLPALDTFEPNLPSWVAYIPVAEVQFTTGAEANVDNFPTWLDDIPFAADAVVTPSVLELTAIAEREPVEVWGFISQYAQAELAVMRTDESDVFNYLGLGWWVRDAQQQVVDSLSTEFNASTVDINTDPTKIRNAVRVSYDHLEVANVRVPVYRISEQLTIAPGVTVVEFAFSNSVVALADNEVLFLDDSVGSATLIRDGSYDAFNFVLLNTATDASGTFATETDGITIEKTSWYAGGTVWTFTNVSGATYYTASAENLPTLQVAGHPLTVTSTYVTDSNDLSVAVRGERALPVSATQGIQTAVDARRLARDLKMALRKPVPIVESLNLFGDTRRQPGDLVTFADPSITRASGLWRVQAVTHQYQIREGTVEYTQPARIRPTKGIGVWGQSTWGTCLWGESSE